MVGFPSLETLDSSIEGLRSVTEDVLITVVVKPIGSDAVQCSPNVRIGGLSLLKLID